ncbi:CaiB/BaiF CoA-transferase family protein [Bradyrhizobium sp. AUGA SZCCT0042]|uniref:CaiB/BaiF CoA transferase family protein n=1 Tax=Bradyrhizobium sp. AUGA SZCCT0042 TaxID=2807651 RepID=UPI001BA49F74|nr:CoA transferase [Bradyrhizobium sp. AUGA SZCCT0042]MBR1297401.1 CoA transferase [Bradyrhizobium sp. AUGA SZCCT0042]
MTFETSPERRGPCSGYRVLDLSTMVSGPMGGQILADLGAEVIKVEALDGDALRGVSIPYRGMGSYFHHFNRSKRSIAIDLKSAEGSELVRRMSVECDALIENFRPGVAERLGLGYDDLKTVNPRLVYASVNGFGDDGPYKDRPAYDHVIQALTGFMPRQGTGEIPVAVKSPVVDKIAAMSSAMSILAALLSRGTDGEGQKVNVKMLDAWAAFILHEQLVNETYLAADAPKTPSADIYRAFATKDGHVLGLIFQDAQFRGMCKALGLIDLSSDPRFASPGVRIMNIGALNEQLAPHIAGMTTAEFLAAMEENGVPFAAVNDLQGFLADPQAKFNGSTFEFEDAKLGRMRGLNFFAIFQGTPLDLRHRAPMLGEHTDEILRQFKYSPSEVDRLRAAKVVR